MGSVGCSSTAGLLAVSSVAVILHCWVTLLVPHRLGYASLNQLDMPSSEHLLGTYR